jgi:selenocysteine lyase/cysteine desulfurase
MDRLERAARALGPGEEADEDFWRLVKGAFPLREGLIFLHAANLCPSPISVQQRVFELTRDVDRDASSDNRRKFGQLREDSRTSLARFLGADADEIAIVRNTSSANATVVNGLDLGPGDEVLLWDQNHPTNSTAWDVRAERYGYAVTRVSTPAQPTSKQELLDPFLAAMTSRTRVVSFSHASNTSGVMLPASELVEAAHSRGAMAMVDGAQSFGCLEVDLHDMGCDFYTGSAHKWFMGPKEAGVLYVRSELQADLWPTHVGIGWSSAVEGGARKFENLGQRDDAAVSAVGTTVDFHETIGTERVEARVRELAAALKNGVADRLPGTAFNSPRDPALSAGVVIFVPPDFDARAALSTLYNEHCIAGAGMGGGIRLCPHIYTTLADIEMVVDTVASLA